VKRLAALTPILAFLALIGVFAGYLVTHRTPQVTPRAMVGKTAPPEMLPPLEGGPPVALSSATGGPTLVNFFASWCAPCAQEAPALAALKAQGVRIVGVAWKDDPANTQGFLARYGDPYAARFADRDGRAGIDFGVSGVPETYVIGADGKILDKVAEPLTGDDANTLAAEVRR
jgi:cytochrome c biogenesis protein CcmG, thiol:disulfide interchange protein DsbE